MKSANHNGTFRYDISCQRHNILEELTWRLEKYRKECPSWLKAKQRQVKLLTNLVSERFVLDHTQMKASPEATQFQISNVKRWLSNANDNAIHEDEVGFLSREGDLIPVVPQVKTPLRRFIDKFNKIRLLPFFRDKKVRDFQPFAISWTMLIDSRSTNIYMEILRTLDYKLLCTVVNRLLTSS